MKFRKKFILIIFSLLVLFGIVLSRLFYITNYQKKEIKEYRYGLATYKYLNSLTVNSFERKINRKNDVTFAYIGNNECSDCSFFFPTLKRTLVNKKLINNIFYVNVEFLHRNKSSWLGFKKRYNFNQTPCLILFKNKKIISKLEWNSERGISERELNSWLEKNLILIKKSF